MCGINGFSYKNESLIKEMNDAIKHRGPDGTGFYTDEDISLGQDLLAITETANNAKQPFESKDGRYVLVYNGEIYNYLKLRDELKKEGDEFETNGDTEVVFKGLIRHGNSFLSKLNGMFAIAFYDKQKKTILLARDRSGMKPLYYYIDQAGQLHFSSELKGLLEIGIERKLDIEIAKIFFYLGYTPGDKTLIKGIKKMCPGQMLTYSLNNGTYQIDWYTDNKLGKENIEFKTDSIQKVISDSVIAHTMGLRPFGLFLSGGLDSTIILHELSVRQKDKINTFTTRFDTNVDIYNEDAELAKRLTKDYDINHTELTVTEEMFMSVIEDTIATLEEPRFNPSTASYYLLMQQASQDVTVVLGGSGGDELFLGYPRYLLSKEINLKYEKWPKSLLDIGYSYKAYKNGLIKKGEFIRLSDSIHRLLFINKVTAPASNSGLSFMKDYSLLKVADYLQDVGYPALGEKSLDIENTLGNLDRLMWLADEDFLRNDKLAMRFGLEGRFPFVADEVVAYANSISSDQKIPKPYSKNSLKYLLRETYKDKLPGYIINKKKTGWNAPLSDWMGSKLGDYVKEVLSNEYYQPTADLFDFDLIKSEHMNDMNKFTKARLQNVLPVFYFQIWAKKYDIVL